MMLANEFRPKTGVCRQYLQAKNLVMGKCIETACVPTSCFRHLTVWPFTVTSTRSPTHPQPSSSTSIIIHSHHHPHLSSSTAIIIHIYHHPHSQSSTGHNHHHPHLSSSTFTIIHRSQPSSSTSIIIHIHNHP
jgi:hypothetical protein